MYLCTCDGIGKPKGKTKGTWSMLAHLRAMLDQLVLMLSSSWTYVGPNTENTRNYGKSRGRNRLAARGVPPSLLWRGENPTGRHADCTVYISILYIVAVDCELDMSIPALQLGHRLFSINLFSGASLRSVLAASCS